MARRTDSLSGGLALRAVPHNPNSPDMIDPFASYPTLFGKWPAKGLAAATARLDISVLTAEYTSLRRDAQQRSKSGKRYFVNHSGRPPSDTGSNRLEEHVAIALVNLDRFWPLPRGGSFRFLDYQVPLKAAQRNPAIGMTSLELLTGAASLS